MPITTKHNRNISRDSDFIVKVNVERGLSTIGSPFFVIETIALRNIEYIECNEWAYNQFSYSLCYKIGLVISIDGDSYRRIDKLLDYRNNIARYNGEFGYIEGMVEGMGIEELGDLVKVVDIIDGAEHIEYIEQMDDPFYGMEV